MPFLVFLYGADEAQRHSSLYSSSVFTNDFQQSSHGFSPRTEEIERIEKDN